MSTLIRGPYKPSLFSSIIDKKDEPILSQPAIDLISTQSRLL